MWFACSVAPGSSTKGLMLLLGWQQRSAGLPAAGAGMTSCHFGARLLLLLMMMMQADWLEVPASYLPLWNQLGFSPVCLRKTLMYATLAPSDSVELAAVFMKVRCFLVGVSATPCNVMTAVHGYLEGVYACVVLWSCRTWFCRTGSKNVLALLLLLLLVWPSLTSYCCCQAPPATTNGCC
jgi:hypothetical protein